MGVLTSEGISKANEILERPSKLGHSPCFKKLFDSGPLVGDIERSRTIEQLLQIDQSESSVYTCLRSQGGERECHRLSPNTAAENQPHFSRNRLLMGNLPSLSLKNLLEDLIQFTDFVSNS